MSIITIAQAVSAIIVVVLVLLQDRSSGVGGAFGGGGGGGGEFYQRRRGMEKIMFGSTIAFAGIFAALSILNLLV